MAMTHPGETKQRNSRLWRLRNGVRRLLLETNIYIAISIPIAIAFLLLLGWGVVVQTLLGGVPSERGMASVFALCSFIASVSGLVQIKRREAPGPYLRSPIKGVFPVLSGALIVAFCWTMGVLLLISVLAP
jgi:hypothetical protein